MQQHFPPETIINFYKQQGKRRRTQHEFLGIISKTTFKKNRPIIVINYFFNYRIQFTVLKNVYDLSLVQRDNELTEAWGTFNFLTRKNEKKERSSF